ncbi:hypothetical protein EVAR_68454_1 [Eumeta japonica]|uniref:Uncharacterized protein n=1 Tax=Eumeta variegata TaxID=151549 RepID=A0A4C1ZZW8_EUMVA|nr:hypothetical protein EVAR_68454_1 [Eumeta japonica]
MTILKVTMITCVPSGSKLTLQLSASAALGADGVGQHNTLKLNLYRTTFVEHGSCVIFSSLKQTVWNNEFAFLTPQLGARTRQRRRA